MGKPFLFLLPPCFALLKTLFLFLLVCCFVLVVKCNFSCICGGGPRFPYFVAVFFLRGGHFLGCFFEIATSKTPEVPTSFCLSVFGKAFVSWS